MSEKQTNKKSEEKNQKTAKCGCKNEKIDIKTAKSAEKHINCTCGDDCDCTPENNCGCGGHEHNEHHKHDDCGCHDHDCGCNGKHDKHHHDREAEYIAVLAQLQKALEEGEKQLKQARDNAIDNQRIAAAYKKDLERYKERTKNVEAEAKEKATEWTVLNMLPILDQFEAALNATAQTNDKVGFTMIYKSLVKMLDNLGIEEIAAQDLPFDTAYHNAVSKKATSNKKQDGVVTAVYQKGYKFKNTDKVIRYAMVEIGEYSK